MAEKSLDIVIRARNEAKAGLKDAESDVKSLGASIAKLVIGGAAIAAASKTLAASTMLIMAGRRQAAALVREDIEGALRGQLEVNRAFAEFGRAVPLVGDSIGKMVEAINDTEGINRMIASLKELETVANRTLATAQKYNRDRILLEAKAAGKSPAEISAIEVGFRATRREAELKAAQADLATAEDSLSAARVAWKDAKQYAESMPFGIGSQKAQLQRTALSKAYEHYVAINKDLLKIKQDVAAADAADAELQAQRAKKEADADKKADEEKAARRQRLFLAESAWLFQHDQARRNEAERKRAATLQKEYSEEDERARVKQQLDDTIFAARHSAEEVALRAINQKYDAWAAQYTSFTGFKPDDPEMRALIEQGRAAELAGIKPTPAAGTSDIAAFSARFLTHAPGRTADPAWAKSLEKKTQTQTDILKTIADKIGVNIDRMRWN